MGIHDGIADGIPVGKEVGGKVSVVVGTFVGTCDGDDRDCEELSWALCPETITQRNRKGKRDVAEIGVMFLISLSSCLSSKK